MKNLYFLYISSEFLIFLANDSGSAPYLRLRGRHWQYHPCGLTPAFVATRRIGPIASFTGALRGTAISTPGHGIVLTVAGERLAEHALQMRQIYKQALAFQPTWQGVEAGMLRLGASTTPASYLLPALVAEFRRKSPAVTVHLSNGNTGQIVDRLSELDLAFIEGEVPPGLPADTRVHAWTSDEVVAIVPANHVLAGLGNVTLSDLARMSLVMREPGSGVRALVEHAFNDAGLSLSIGLELAGGRVREASGARRFGRRLRLRHFDASRRWQLGCFTRKTLTITTSVKYLGAACPSTG
jgi:LysR substrate binding domain